MSRAEVLKTATEYFKGNELQATLWVDKYCLRNRAGEYLEATPDYMFHRLAKEFARIELKYPNPLYEEEIYNLLKDFTYVIPGGSILFGVGNDHVYTSLGNCFVIGDSTDSYGSICKIDEEQAQLMKRRGGVGHDISHLRPKGTSVNNAACTSTGAVSFMSRYSNTTREVAQGGRRGALMLTMSVDHPDIIDFISSKSDLTKLTGCNISVKVGDTFMQSVKAGDTYTTEVWSKLVYQAHATAEPGILFWDTITNNSPADKYKGFESVSTNPCGEIPLCPYDTCRLMSVNLFSFVNKPFTPQASFNAIKFVDVVNKAQRLMDDVIDLEKEKIDKILKKISPAKVNSDSTHREYILWTKIYEKLHKGRRTGLSVIGLADCLAALNVKYGSPESISTIDFMFNIFRKAAYTSSEYMAEERGAFPVWDKNIDPMPRRNIALLTIPPSGTISIMAGVTSGIEPVFNLSYTRRRKVEESDNVVFVDKQGDKWEEYTVLHPKLYDYAKIKGYKIEHPYTGILKQLVAVESPYYGCTAHDINPLDRVKMQATIQKYIDHSIASTINLPATATVEDISNIYMAAWESGCKGITVYREGCRDGVLINKSEKKTEFEQHNAPKRPKILRAQVNEVKIKGITYSVLVGLFNDKPYEVFVLNYSLPSVEGDIIKNSKGNYTYGTINVTENLTDEQAAITRLTSTALRHGTDIKFIVEQLNKISGDLTSFSKAIARVLRKYIPNGTDIKGLKCEVCGNGLIMENGCMICKSCGNSKCS